MKSYLQHSEAPPTVWGAAYRIPAPKVAEVRAYLDLREINGYSMQYTPFHASSDHRAQLPSGQTVKCLVYIGLPDNPQFLGPQDPQALAEHIVSSNGPSGENREYLYQLDEALRGLSVESEDEHVGDLARRCREVEARVLVAEQDGSVGGDGAELKMSTSTDEQEEVEK